MLITKSSGEVEEFNRRQYEDTLKRVGLTPAEVKEIGSEIYQDLYPEIPAKEIYFKTHQFLRKKNRILAAKYSLKKAIMNLGPGGYFFERYMAVVLSAYGYKTKFNQFIQGKCVEHEVDIVAERAGKKYLVECKYHIGSGIRSDLKVVLYVYARFLDLKAQGFAEAVLITNTSCTSEAVKYAQCAGLKVISWHYPNLEQSLEHFVESKKLYPVTVITYLNYNLNRLFRENNIILASDLLKFTPQVLARKFNLKEGFAKNLINEARLLTE